MGFNDTFITLKNRINDWLIRDGGNITDLAGDLLNRSQYQLWESEPWDRLVKNVILTISNKSASLPSDFGREIFIYSDFDSDGKPDRYYYRDGDRSTGYRITDTFDKTTGHSRVVTFFGDTESNMYIRYLAVIEDMTADTDYSYFPSDLVLCKAQIIHISENGGDGNELNPLIMQYDKLMLDYIQKTQYVNNDMKMSVNDNNGIEISNPNYSLGDGPQWSDDNYGYPNSYLE